MGLTYLPNKTGISFEWHLDKVLSREIEHPISNKEYPTPKCVRLANVLSNGTPFASNAHLDIGYSLLAVGH